MIHVHIYSTALAASLPPSVINSIHTFVQESEGNWTILRGQKEIFGVLYIRSRLQVSAWIDGIILFSEVYVLY